MTMFPSDAANDQTAHPGPSLDPALRDWLAKVNDTQADSRRRGVPDTPDSARKGLAALTRTLGGRGPAIDRVLDIAIGPGEIPARLYDPEPGRAKPACLYLHGGGHMAGSVEVYDPICRRLAAASGRIVVSVDYRLAPEHPYPAGLTDALTALRHLPAALDAHGCASSGPIALAGDSGGGALAATLASITRHRPDIRLDRLILIYPSLDYTLVHPSLDENGQGYLLDTDKVRWYFDHYFQHGEDRRHASPLYLPMVGLPPTLVVTAERCPLRDEGLAYVRGLAEAGVPHEHLAMPGLIHAYLNLHELVPRACTRTYGAIASFLRRRPLLAATPGPHA